MNKLEALFSDFEKETNVDLKNFSTMKVGGRGKIVLFPHSVVELKGICKRAESNSVKLLILGNGSNVLFSDEGFDGAIVKLSHFQKFKILRRPKRGKKSVEKLAKKSERQFRRRFECKKRTRRQKNLENCEICEKMREKHEKKCKKFARNTFLIEIGAGVNLFALNLKLKEFGASGLEFSYGIPATLGGFLRMNGGCFGHEVCEVVHSVQVLECGKVRWMKKCDLKFSYRDSNLKNCIILGAKLRFFAQKSEKIEKTMRKFLLKKRNSQPCNFPSLGSVFKKCGDISPAKIIDQLGLKGLSIGGAQVSTLHAGFIVNTGSATSNDVKKLILHLSQRLKEAGFTAQTEIAIV